MILLMFPHVSELTSNYHSGGGLAIVAHDRAEAQLLIDQHNRQNKYWWQEGDDAEPEDSLHPTEEEWSRVVEYPLAGEHEPRLWIFQDAGCC